MRIIDKFAEHLLGSPSLALSLSLLLLLSSAAPGALTRQWTIFVNHDSHTDLGFTGDQEELRTQVYPRYLDSLFAFIERSNSWDENSKVRCTIESSYWLYGSALAGMRNADWVERLKGYIAGGRISYNANLATYYHENIGGEELVRSNYYSQRHLYDILGGGSSGIMMISDNPGMTWSAVNAMLGAGVKYSIMRTPGWPWAQNCDPSALEGQNPANHLLVWNGVYYPTDEFGLRGSDATASFNSMVQKCQSLEASASYPYDAYLVDLTDMGDNTALLWRVYDNIHKINAMGNGNPRVILSSPRRFFEHIDSSGLTIVRKWRGSIESWWTYGMGAVAHDNAVARTAQERLPGGEAFSALASVISPGIPYPYETIANGYFDATVWVEHTYWPYPWMQKKAVGASASADTLLARSMKDLSKSIPTTGMTLVVFNYLSQDRTDLVKVQRGGLPQFFDIIDNATGGAVPWQNTNQGEIAFVARGIPALGYKTYSIRQRSDNPAGPIAVTASGNILENRYFRVTFGTRGQMRSIIDKMHANTELVDQASDTGANEFWYITTATGQKDILSSNSVASAALSPASGTVFGAMTAIGRATGVDSMERTVILYDSLPRIDIVNYMKKSPAPSSGDEEGYFIFPLRMPNFQLYHGICSGVMQPGVDQVQVDEYHGSCTDYYTVNKWVDVSNKNDYGISIATLDAPLVEYGARRTYFSSVNYRAARPWVYSYVFNNKWGVNWPRSQPGPITFRYSLQPHAGGTWLAGGAPEFGAQFANPMPCVVINGPQAGDGRFATASGRFLQVSPSSVVLTAMKLAETNGEGVILRFNETHGLQTTVTVKAPLLNPGAVIETDLVENDRASVPVSNGTFSFTIGPFDWKTFRVLSPRSVPSVSSISGSPGPSGTLVTWPIPAGPVSYYEIFRDTSQNFTPGAGNYRASVSVNSYSDNQLTSSCTKHYYYKIRAVSGSAKGIYPAIGVIAGPSHPTLLTTMGISYRQRPWPALTFSIPSPLSVRIDIIDAAGRIVAVPVNSIMKAGPHTIVLCREGRNLATGMYYARIRIDNGAPVTAAFIVLR
jgi:hypothetical protein